jgi:crossover junction endodeoxyribonuclease RusA
MNELICELELPYPPSTNTYWRSKRGTTRKYISEKGVAFLSEVQSIIEQSGLCLNIDHCVALEIKLYPPDLRRRDIDNTLKATFDSLEKSGLIKDDCLITMLNIEKLEKVKGGKMLIKISSLKPLK